MTSDIVEQLRAWAEPISSGYEVPRAAVTLYEAADEIKSLRSRLAEADAHGKAQQRWAHEWRDKHDALTAENAALRKDAERMRGELALIVALQAGDGSTINGPTRDDFGRAFRMAQDIARAAMEQSHE